MYGKEWVDTAKGTPSESLLEALAGGGDLQVRRAVLTNPNCPPGALVDIALRAVKDSDLDTQREVLARPDCPDEAVAAIAARAATDWDLQVAAEVLRSAPGCPARDSHFCGRIGSAMAFAARQGMDGACPREEWDLLWSCPNLAKMAKAMGGQQ